MTLTEAQKRKVEAEEQYRAQVRKELKEQEAVPVKSGGCLKTLIMFFLVLPAAIIFFPVTIAFVVSKQINRSTMKRKGLLSAAILALGVIVTIVLYDGAYQRGETEKMLRQMPHPVTQQEKTDFESFYREFMRIGNESDKINDAILDDLNALGNGNASSLAVYTNAKNAEKNQRALSYQMTFLIIPESLSSYRDQLTESTGNMSYAIGARAGSMKTLAEFINSGNLDKTYQFKEKNEQQQRFMLDAISDIIAVAQKLGVDVREIR